MSDYIAQLFIVLSQALSLLHLISVFSRFLRARERGRGFEAKATMAGQLMPGPDKLKSQ